VGGEDGGEVFGGGDSGGHFLCGVFWFLGWLLLSLVVGFFPWVIWGCWWVVRGDGCGWGQLGSGVVG
jgi:hypothetical protein